MAMLEVKNLEVYYGVICALKGISFEVNEGEIVSLIGANGAGKTTMMQSVVGLIPKKSGTVSRLSVAKNEHSEPYYVPGFGKNGSSNIGISYNLYYNLPF